MAASAIVLECMTEGGGYFYSAWTLTVNRSFSKVICTDPDELICDVFQKGLHSPNLKVLRKAQCAKIQNGCHLFLLVVLSASVFGFFFWNSSFDRGAGCNTNDMFEHSFTLLLPFLQ